MSEEKAPTTTEFLIAEYQEMFQELRRIREEGLERLNFLITLTSSVIAGLIVLFEVSSFPVKAFQFIAIGALVFLITIAWGTFTFSIYRDTSSDFRFRAISRIRKYFVIHNPEIATHLTWQYHDEPTFWVRNDRSNIRRTSQTILALLCGLLVGIVVNLLSRNLIFAATMGIAFVGLIWILLFVYTNRQLRQALENAISDVRFPIINESSQKTEPKLTTPTPEKEVTNTTNEDQ